MALAHMPTNQLVKNMSQFHQSGPSPDLGKDSWLFLNPKIPKTLQLVYKVRVFPSHRLSITYPQEVKLPMHPPLLELLGFTTGPLGPGMDHPRKERRQAPGTS